MHKGNDSLTSIKNELKRFANNHPGVQRCMCTEGKITKPVHKAHPNAIVTKKAEYNINVRPQYVILGIRTRSQTFNCRLDTNDPNTIKDEIKKFIEENG